jgi:hypothetical protein
MCHYNSGFNESGRATSARQGAPRERNAVHTALTMTPIRCVLMERSLGGSGIHALTPVRMLEKIEAEPA